ncbi:hypothetical protein [Neisseria canis]|uniref:Uncharacterized protein n=1 Tax=Neisseria canis TaxID=493 RepID=A0A3S4NNH4_9NEIS|nr:hypothetical protein [Neisseria canis]VEF01021.1 Uncharacterised protein [Neisseria canis]
MMNYTNNLPYSKLMVQAQANIKNLKPNQLTQAKELLALMKAESNGATSLYKAVLEAAKAGVEPTLVLQQARIAIQQHQADIQALSHAIARQDSVTERRG